MTHGSLFSGIGGFDLASQWMGWENLFHCEKNEFAQKVLHHYWPKAQSYEDITETDFTIWRGRIDIITGGFPCQPFSQAGLQLGTEDDRHLWPSMLRCIQEVQPRWVVGENVLGILNWNDGMVFDQVQTDLESAGYSVQTYVLPAAGVNAPHRRNRVWFVGYSDRGGRQEHGFSTGGQMSEDNPERERSVANTVNGGHQAERGAVSKEEGLPGECRETMVCGESDRTSVSRTTADTGCSEPQGREKSSSNNDRCCQEGLQEGDKPTSRISDGDATHSESQRHAKPCSWDEEFQAPIGQKLYGRDRFGDGGSGRWENFPTQPPICDGNDGLSSRLDGITFPKWRNESIKAGGNAIVPQVAQQIFKAIEKWEQNHANKTQR